MDDKPIAVFLGLQEVLYGDPLPLYNIIGGTRHGSTVSTRTLLELGIEIQDDDKGGK
jgi:hypothetical protein